MVQDGPPSGFESLADKTVADVLGQITWLMSQSAHHRGYFISDLEWMVMPAILLKQFRVFHRDKTPVACVVWAEVNKEVAERITSGDFRLKPSEWRCGNIPLITQTIAPFGQPEQLRGELQAELTERAKQVQAAKDSGMG